jgi:hypothetical protein
LFANRPRSGEGAYSQNPAAAAAVGCTTKLERCPVAVAALDLTHDGSNPFGGTASEIDASGTHYSSKI